MTTLTLPREVIEQVQEALDRLEKLDPFTTDPNDVWSAVGFGAGVGWRLRLWVRDCEAMEKEEQHG